MECEFPQSGCPTSTTLRIVQVVGDLALRSRIKEQWYSDTPISLMLAAMQAIPALTGTDGTGFNFSIFTGDLTAHDPDNQYSRCVCPH